MHLSFMAGLGNELKLEKEANIKGIPFGQAHDFEIPPPRPKRKPYSPYPRKNGASSLSLFVEAMDGRTSKSPSSVFHAKQATDIENHAAWKIQGMKDNFEDGNGLEVLNLFQEAPSSSFNGFHPLELHMKDNIATQGSFTSFDVNKRTRVNSQAISAQKEVDSSMQPDQRYMKNVSIDLMERSGAGNVPATAVANAIPSTSGSDKTNNQSFPSDPDDYRSLFNASTIFSGFIMSALLQNPVLHAAVSQKALIDSSSSQDLHGRTPSTNPSMAAIADAIISAAAAWWATQGLVSNHADFNPAPDDKKEEREGTLQNSSVINQKSTDPEQSDNPRFPFPNLTSLTLSPSSDSDVSGSGEPMDHAKTNKFKPLSSNGVHKSYKARNKKKYDRSSCGSNAPSSNDAETDPVLMKNKDEKESEKVHLNRPADGNTCQTRSSASMNESWKKVSEEGRLTFQSLFEREIVPQSFVLPHAKESEPMTEDKGKEAIKELPAVDLNTKASTSTPTNLYYPQGFCVASGFKPYKRCSVESKEKRAIGSDARKKKIRLEVETSI